MSPFEDDGIPTSPEDGTSTLKLDFTFRERGMAAFRTTKYLRTNQRMPRGLDHICRGRKLYGRGETVPMLDRPYIRGEASSAVCLISITLHALATDETRDHLEAVLAAANARFILLKYRDSMLLK